jgi:type VII secretion integral membrane protein EccD
VPTAYSRVTVVNGARRVDLALPAALAVSDVVPQLLRFCAPAERPERPAAWTLGRLGGPSLGLAQNLADAGVLDGDVLELRSLEAAARPAYVDDVRDAIEDAVDESGGQWRSRTTVGFALAVSAVGVASSAVMPLAYPTGIAGTLAAAVLVAGLCVVGGWWATTRAHPGAVQLVVAAGCLWGGIGTWLVATSLAWPRLAAAAAWTAGALLVSAIARALTPLATPHLAACAILTATAVVTVVAGQAPDPLAPARVVAMLAVLVTGALPRAAISAGGLATADYRVRASTLVTEKELVDRVRQSTALVFGGVLAVAGVGAVAGVVLAYATSTWDRLLGPTVGVALVLRSRVFSRAMHVVPLRIAGVVVLAAVGARLASLPAVRPWSMVLAAAVGLVLVALSATPLSGITRARVKRLLNWTESAVIVAMVALAAAGLGLYDLVAHSTG